LVTTIVANTFSAVLVGALFRVTLRGIVVLEKFAKKPCLMESKLVLSKGDQEIAL
jgi:hypothetical protein